ncbi:MAG: preprotein translocase subunit SecF [Candidatus Dependentiae bacterium]|nr:preprotein translocase subunit SecF [Candidatus Dependentiae bacterium]
MINFLRYRSVCAAFSVLFLCAGVAAYVYRGGFNYHIDFVGGTELQVKFEKAISSADLRSALSGDAWKDPVIQSLGATNTQFLVRVKDGGESLEDRFLDTAHKKLHNNAVEVENIAWVGAEVGNDIKWDAFVAIVLALLGMLLYIAMRSQYRFAVGAVIALAHDILIVLAVLLMLNEQVSLNVLAALLTTLGYSINDTIVIFSRIQENFATLKNNTEEEIVNISINQTLRRTLLTSFTTFLAVLALYLLGGEALRGFSLSMLVGIVAGTYSSIYIASPVMLAIGAQQR